MKIRNAFVANSSSASFLIYGIRINEADANKYMGSYNSTVNKDGYKIEYGKYGICWETVEYSGHNLVTWDRDRAVYIGRSWDSIGRNQTRAEFEKEVEDKIAEIFPGIEHNFGTHQDAWYDG